NNVVSTYSLSLSSTGDPKDNAYTDGLRQPAFSAIQGQPPEVSIDAQTGLSSITSGTATVLFTPDTATGVTPSSSVTLALLNPVPDAPVSSFAFNNDAVQRVALLDGNLGVVIADPDAPGEIYYHIEAYPWNTVFQDTTGFRSIQLPAGDARAIAKANRTVVKSVWILPGCLGVELTEGRRLFTEGISLNLNLEPGDGSADKPLTAQPIEVLGRPAPEGDPTPPQNYLLTLNWIELKQVIASAGVVTLDFEDGRMMQLDRSVFDMVRVPADAEGSDPLFKISERVAVASGGTEAVDLISTDWKNVLRFLLTLDGTTIDVLDRRARIPRAGQRAARIQTDEGVIRIIWDDGAESLLLTEADDFIEIDTPAEAAEAAYEPMALPGDPGYRPVGLNNVGQECYPVTTAFNFNCAPNGFANPANGSLSLSVTDVYARGYQLDLTLSRTYNSANFRQDGPFGLGWSSDYLLDYNVLFDQRAPRVRSVDRGSDYQSGLNLVYAPRGEVTFTTASGSRHEFTLLDESGVQTWSSQTLPGWTVELRPNALFDPWRVIRANGLVYEFDTAGRLRSVRHPHGGALTVTREAEFPAVYVISDDVGRSLRLEYDEAYHITRTVLLDGDATLAESLYTYDNSLLVG
ncbi:MAG: RHS repeat protein, partial [Armatimonadetes bacterium]|nr:RHS repeat protein [Anaerolineae bacterium]